MLRAWRRIDSAARGLLEAAEKPDGRVRLASFLASFGNEAGLSDHEFSIFENLRDRTPARPVSFE
jgi:antitoxin FitA